MGKINSVSHSADAAALGFYFQTFYALHAILEQPHDDATVCLEKLDDVEIHANGQTLLSQLKHSMSNAPASVTISSNALWKTLKAWIDVLPKVEIGETSFQLVTVAPLGKSGCLNVLLNENNDRSTLYKELISEAKRVVNEFTISKNKNKNPLPHLDRIKACETFLNLDESTCLSMLSRTSIRSGSVDISKIEAKVAELLVNFPPNNRVSIARRLLEWWDLQVVFTMCGKRERFIAKIEIQEKIAEISGEITRDELIADFENMLPPNEHQSDSMLVKQIELVNGKASDIELATREEWRARAQRHKWSQERLDMAVRIDLYDQILMEAWRDKHLRMIENCEGFEDTQKCQSGLNLLRWSHDDAHKDIRPFAQNWNASYYIRGSFQVLAINLQVGWHPDFKLLLSKSA